MITPFENLSDKHQAILKDAPFWVTMWVGLADGHFNKKEQIAAIQTIEIKAFSESPDVSVLYQKVQNPGNRLAELMMTLSGDIESDKALVKEHLLILKSTLENIDKSFAQALFRSLKNVGVYVALASGGIFGYDNVSRSEKVAYLLEFVKPDFK